jgi:hypothetical protein
LKVKVLHSAQLQYAVALLPLAVPPLAISMQIPPDGIVGALVWSSFGLGMAACIWLVVRYGSEPLWARAAGIGTVVTISYLAPLVAWLCFSGASPERATWQAFVPPAAGCQIQMPGTPTTSQSRMPNVIEDQTIHIVQRQPLNDLFGLSYGAIPLDLVGHPDVVNECLDRVGQGMLGGQPGRELLQQRPIQLGKFPGREFVFRDPVLGTMVLRVYLAQHRVYMLMAGGPQSTPEAADVRMFFDSFVLTGSTDGDGR